jgi:hypothetical protein
MKLLRCKKIYSKGANSRYVSVLTIKLTRCTISQLYFGKQLYIFQADLLSIIRSLNTVFTAVGFCHAEILKMGKITSVYIYMYIVVKL